MAGYVIEHEGRQFDPNGRVEVVDADNHNGNLEQAELAHWQAKPEVTSCYIIPNKEYDPTRLGSPGLYNPKYIATTWLGTRIGTVHVSSMWKRYNKYGEPYTMKSIYVHGTNGVLYTGQYGSDWSQLCRLRRVKSS